MNEDAISVQNKKKKTVVKNRHIQIDHTYGYVGKGFCDGAN